jgi:hypothetical protein
MRENIKEETNHGNRVKKKIERGGQVPKALNREFTKKREVLGRLVGWM